MHLFIFRRRCAPNYRCCCCCCCLCAHVICVYIFMFLVCYISLAYCRFVCVPECWTYPCSHHQLRIIIITIKTDETNSSMLFGVKWFGVRHFSRKKTKPYKTKQIGKKRRDIHMNRRGEKNEQQQRKHRTTQLKRAKQKIERIKQNVWCE